MYFDDIFNIKRKIRLFLKAFNGVKNKETIPILFNKLNDLSYYKNQIISLKNEGILESNFEFQKVLNYCCDFYKRINKYKKELEQAELLDIINNCLRIRDVSSCKECSRCNTNICRLLLKKELTEDEMIKYWRKMIKV